jgi:hypothetical protein
MQVPRGLPTIGACRIAREVISNDEGQRPSQVLGRDVEANAQANINPNVYPGNMGERYGTRGPAYAPSRKYARRAYRRSARAPRPSGNNLVYTPGSGPPPYDVSRQVYASQSSGSWEWHAAPGPNKRGNMCITHTDPMRGYGFQGECKK